jgi:hypothetical protein
LAEGHWVPGGSWLQRNLDCDQGDVAVSGGYEVNDYAINPYGPPPVEVYLNRPAGTLGEPQTWDAVQQRWRFGVWNVDGAQHAIHL